MTKIAIICDQSDTDELGIRLTAEEKGMDLQLLPFFKTTFTISNGSYRYRTLGHDHTNILNDVQVVINRCQSKSRRLYASAIVESIKKKVINSQSIEYNCQSKLRTLLLFASAGVLIPKTVYALPNVKEKITSGGLLDNTEAISEMLNKEFSNELVLKPDFGTHGKGVTLINSPRKLKLALGKIAPSLINPSGVLAQEYISKWFFDLRIIVSKEKSKPPFCQRNALARGGFKGFRTNTFLGNMVFQVKLPEKVIYEAVKCANSITNGEDAWVIGLDAMPKVAPKLIQNEEFLKKQFELLEKPFSDVTRIKEMPSKKLHFKEYSEAINHAYSQYMNTDAYRYIEETANSILHSASTKVLFHEGNACPEFWEQTRAVAGINLAELLLSSAQSVIDR